MGKGFGPLLHPYPHGHEGSRACGCSPQEGVDQNSGTSYSGPIELRAICLIPAPKTVDSLLGVMSQHGTGYLKSGVCTVYPTTNLLHPPPPPHGNNSAERTLSCP